MKEGAGRGNVQRWQQQPLLPPQYKRKLWVILSLGSQWRELGSSGASRPTREGPAPPDGWAEPTAGEQVPLTPRFSPCCSKPLNSHTLRCARCAKSTDPSMSWFRSWKQKKLFSYISFLLVLQTKLSNRWVRCVSVLVKTKRRNCIFW